MYVFTLLWILVMFQVTCKAIVVAEKFRGQSLYNMLLKLIPELDANKCEYVSSQN